MCALSRAGPHICALICFQTRALVCVLSCVCVCVTFGQGSCWIVRFDCQYKQGGQQEREYATNEDTLAFLVILGLIIPAYLLRTQ